MFKFILAILITACLAGCPSNNPQYLTQPESIENVDVYVHSPSGMTFPQNIDEFKRICCCQCFMAYCSILCG